MNALKLSITQFHSQLEAASLDKKPIIRKLEPRARDVKNRRLSHLAPSRGDIS
jgi:hypothetical protein